MSKKYLNLDGLSSFLANLRGIFSEKDHVHDDATTSTSGFMSATDKAKLDGLQPVDNIPDSLTDFGVTATAEELNYMSGVTSGVQAQLNNIQSQVDGKADADDLSSHIGDVTVHITSSERTNWNSAKTHADSAHAPSNAEKNQNAFSNIAIGSTTIAADIATDTLTLAGSNVTLTPDETNDKLTIGVTKSNVTSALGYTPPTASTATSESDGLMSVEDKIKLDTIASGAETNQNAFSNIVVGSTTIAADGKTDTFTIAAGANVTLTPDAANDKVTIAATNTTYSVATESVDGLMSADDKDKLDGIADGANKYVLPVAGSALGGVKSGTDISVDSSGNVSVNNDSHNHTASTITSVNASAIVGTIPTDNLPSYVDDVLEYDTIDNFPDTGEAGKIYVDIDTNKTYRWGGAESGYVEISASLALGETSSTAYRGDRGAAAYKHAVTNKGSAFSSGLYKITTNSEGHVTAATVVTKSDITGLGIPASDTDTKVTQTVSTTNANYPLLLAPSGQTATTTTTANFGTKFQANPSTGTLTATSFVGSLAGNADTASKLGTSTVGGTANPIYLSAGTATACSDTVGSATQPVYMSKGTISPCTYTLGKSVPSNAIFTDTTYSVATSSTNGLMSKDDKQKLDALGGVVTISKSITLSTSWQDTGIAGTNLDTGTYVVQVSGLSSTTTTTHSEIWSGVFSWYAGTTNSTNAEEIFLHNAGHADNSNEIYLRTIRSSSGGYLKLQISSKAAGSAADTIVFKFRKLI